VANITLGSSPDDQDAGLAEVAARQGESDQANRVFAHGMHEENNLIQRGHFFLVAESMILVAYSLMISGRPAMPTPDHLLSVRVMAAFGLIVAIVWLYAGNRQWRYFKILRARAYELLPEYRETRSRLRVGLVSSTPIIAHGIPAITAVMWCVLLLTA
jgi:hypothetical protein